MPKGGREVAERRRWLPSWREGRAAHSLVVVIVAARPHREAGGPREPHGPSRAHTRAHARLQHGGARPQLMESLVVDAALIGQIDAAKAAPASRARRADAAGTGAGDADAVADAEHGLQRRRGR